MPATRGSCLLVALIVSVPVLFPVMGSAATTELRVLFDVDRDGATGCVVSGLAGVDQVLVTRITDSETAASVTQTHRQLCEGGLLGAPIDVNVTGWPAGWNSSSGQMLVETRVPFSAFGPGSMAPWMYVAFTGTRGAGSFATLAQANGDRLMVPPQPAGRRHAVSHPGPVRTITMDGQDSDWNGIAALTTGSAGAGPSSIELLESLVFGNPNDSFLYFNFSVDVSSQGNVAVDDTYTRTQGFPSFTQPAPGVLDNDVSNGPVTAIPVATPDDGTLVLNPDGSFTYTPNDPDSVSPDAFYYMAVAGSDQSNVARVRIHVERVDEAPAFTSASSVQLQAGVAANFTVMAGGIPDPDITATGALPAGVTFTDNGNGTATIGGTPIAGSGGAYPIVITANNSGGTATQNFTIVVCNTIAVTNPVTATGTASAAFNQTFTQTGAVLTATFTIDSGALPAGLALATNGTLSGTPTVTGSFPITVRVTDSNGCTNVGATYNLVINCQTITVTNPGTTTGTAGTAFSQTFTQTGTIGGATFTTASTLPAGLTLAANGTLSGTPTQTGTFPIAVTVTDANGCTGTGATYPLVIGCQTITVTNPATTTGTAGVAFNQTFTQSAAIGGATFTTASTLPAGLTLATNGTLSGTPTQTGTFPIVVTVTDGNGCSGTSASYSLIINCQTITVTNPATETATVGTAFSQTFMQTSAIGTATFTTASTLPTGLTLATNGTLSGTTTQFGSFPIVVTVMDSNGCTGTGATYTLVVNCQSITVTNPGVTGGVAGTPFSQTFTESGALGGATFTTASTLPAGLTLATNGLLSGTPTQTGSFPIVVTVTDGNGCTGTGATYTLVIACQTITVTNPANANGTASSAFSETFTQAGALGGATFTTSSTLPAGLNLATNGTLSGTPTQTGSFPIVVTVTDGNGCTGTGATYALVIACQTITVTNPVNVNGVADTAFSETFTQSGAIGTATFTTASTLPAGLTLATNGLISGTPTQTGSFPIIVTVTDSNGCTGTGATYTLVIGCQVIPVTNPVTTTGTVSAAFSETFTQTGSIGTATFTTATTLPAGLTLAANGVLSGTPTEDGSFPIVVTVTDSNGCTGTSATYTLVVGCQTIAVTNPVNTSGTVNASFSETFTQSSAVGGATFTLGSGVLPAGMTLSTGGLLSGTPTQAGSFPITVLVTDGNGCTGTSATYTLVIACQIITVTNPANATGPAGSPFSETFTQIGAFGTATFTTASTLPTGLSLSTVGVLSGTPNQGGTFPITVLVTDSNGCTGTSAVYNLIITCPVITLTNPANANGTANAAFSETFTEAGAIGGATFTLASGTLPTGMSLSTAGVLSGTPTQTGSFPIAVLVTDGNGCTGTSATYTIVIACQAISVTNPANAAGVANTAFSETFTQTGAIGGVTFTVATGTLPTGLSLSAAGVLSGTPAQTGTFPITVTSTDSNGCSGTGATYTIIIACQTIAVTNPVNATGTILVGFSESFTQTGAIGTATFTLNSGSLPSGLTLSTAGVLSGTPTVTGSFPITVLVTDSNGCTGTSATYTIVINCQTITAANPGVSTGTVSAAFSQTFTQAGANGGATFTLNSGSLPSGLTLSTVGVLAGTPTQSGSFPITVLVTDGNGCTGVSATYNLFIACQTITVTNPAVTTGTAASVFSQTFTQTGGFGTTNFSTASALPTGLSLSTAGVLSGTPTQTGSFPIVVTATDSNGCTGSGATWTLVIGCQTISVTNPGVTTGTVDAAFSQSFSQTGAIGGATFTVDSGTLPPGLTLSAAGVLSGLPSTPGSYPFTVKVTDGNGCTGIGTTYTLVISCQTIAVTNPVNVNGTAGVAFSETFTQSGVGTHTPAAFTIASGSLPNGLLLSSAGVLSGTPTQNGSFPITVTVTDANGCSGTGATYNLFIACPTFIFVPANTLPNATYQTAYSQNISVSGGAGPFTLTLANATSVPSTFTFTDNGNGTATVAGANPGVTGVFTFDVNVLDTSSTCTQTQTFSLTVIPKVVNDIYAASGGNAGSTDSVGNTQAVAAGFSAPATPYVNYATGVLANDAAPGGTLTVVTASVTNAAGTITFNAAGGWSYVPAVNFTGTASFAFVVASNGAQANASINVAVSNKVWYVKNDAGGGGTGLSSLPFNTLVAAQTASAVGEIIYVMTGDGLVTGQNAGILLKNTQQLIGAGVALVVNGNTLAAAGTKPRIGNTGGFAITLANGNTLRGFTATTTVAATQAGISGNALTTGPTIDTVNIGPTTGAGLNITASGTITTSLTTVAISGAATVGIDANNFGTLTINSGVSVAGVQALALNTGTVNGTFGTVTATGGTNGIALTSCAGTITIPAGSSLSGASGDEFLITGVTPTINVTYQGNITYGGSSNAINITATTGVYNGNITFETGTINVTGGTGVRVVAANGTHNYMVGSGTFTVNGAGTGVNLGINSNGTYNFGTGFTITNTTGTSFNVSNTAADATYSGNITQGTNALAVGIVSLNSSGFVTFQTGTVSATNGAGISLADADGPVTFNGTTTLNGGDAGIDVTAGGDAVNGSAGTITFGASSSITNPTGALIDIQSSRPNFTYSGTFTKNNNAATAFNIANNKAGLAVTINGASAPKTLSTTTANAIVVSGNNVSSTITFGGGSLSVTTTTGIGVNATGAGTLTFSGAANNLTSGNTALLVNGLALGTSTLNNVNTTGGSSGISLTNTTGSLTITGGALSGATGPTFLVSGGTVSVTDGGTIAQATAAQPAVSVTGNHTAGTLTFTGNITATNGTGIAFDNADGTYNISGTTNAFTGGSGLSITNGSAGTFTFASGTTITNGLVGANSACFSVNGSAPNVTYSGGITKNAAIVGTVVDITNQSAGTITFQTGTITGSSSASGGIAFVNADGTTNFNGTTTLSGGTNGISVATGTDTANGSQGTISFGSGTTITDVGGTSVAIFRTTGTDQGNTVAFTYSGTITDDVGTLVSIVGEKSGLKAFTGAITDGNDGDGSGITLTTNGSATIQFSGGLTLATGANPAFAATGGGTVEVCDETPCNAAATGVLINRIATTTGTALNVTNTTISANQLEFRSISVDGNDSLPTNGIVLSSTGSSGGLKVKGTGPAGSGGTIQDAADDGILLSSTGAVSLSSVNITSNLGNGIGGSSVNGLVLEGCSITSNGNDAATDDCGIDLVDLTGTSFGGSNPTRIANTTISNNHEFEVQITNFSGTLTDLQWANNTISSDGLSGAHGNLLNFLALDSANMTLNATGGTYTGAAPNTATAIQCDHSGTSGTVTCNVSGPATFTNNNVGPQGSISNGGSVVANFSNFTTTGNRSMGINFFAAASSTGSLLARVTNAVVGTLGVPGSGSSLGYGIRLQNESVPTTANVRLAVTGTTVQEAASFSLINVNQGIAGQTSSGSTNVTITGNTLRNSAARAIVVQQNNGTDADSAGSTCVDISANAMTNIPGQVGDGTYIRLRRLDANSAVGDTFKVRQTSLADLAAQNSITTAQLAIGGTMTYSGGACPQP